jgi:hypothetical protein
VALVILAASVVLAMNGDDRSTDIATAPTREEAVPAWWANAHGAVTDVRQAITDARRSLDRLDSERLEKACQDMHDAAGVNLHT